MSESEHNWVKIHVLIKEVATGEIVEFDDKTIFDPDFYMWREGNYSCDCNRELFFNRAKDPKFGYFHFECGDERYLVRIFNHKDGKIVFDEFEPELEWFDEEIFESGYGYRFELEDFEIIEVD